LVRSRRRILVVKASPAAINSLGSEVSPTRRKRTLPEEEVVAAEAAEVAEEPGLIVTTSPCQRREVMRRRRSRGWITMTSQLYEIGCSCKYRAPRRSLADDIVISKQR